LDARESVLTDEAGRPKPSKEGLRIKRGGEKMSKISTKYSELLNSVKYQQLRNNDGEYLKQLFRTYANMMLPVLDKVVSTKQCRGAMVDLYNKTFQLNLKGFIEYIETKLPKRDFIAVIEQA
jgi:hypothetical protein